MLDILIKDALIIDGTGEPSFRGSVGIQGEKIVSVGTYSGEASGQVIDAEGLCCCPGFIDSHGHADLSLPFYPENESLLVQGITSHVGGNCGITLAPAANAAFARAYSEALHIGEVDIAWRTFADWLAYVERRSLGANYVPLVGLNAIRGSALGPDYMRPSTSQEIAQELGLLEEALEAGAFGLSYSADAGVPGHFADAGEMEALFALLEQRNSLVTAHTRHHQNQWPSEDGRTYYGVFLGNKGEVLCGRYHGFQEFLEYCLKRPGLRAVVSHLTNAFLMPMPHSQMLEDAMIDETLRTFVDDPAKLGLDIYFNLIPSDQSINSACLVLENLTRSLKYDAELSGYREYGAFLKGLESAGFRARMRETINSGRFKIGMLSPATDPYWSDTYRFIKAKDERLVGKTLWEVTCANRTGARTELVYNACIEVLFDLVREDPALEWVLIKDKREYMGHRRLLCHPRSMPMTDAVSTPLRVDPSRDILEFGTPPTTYSMFVRFLVGMCKERQLLSREEAVRKLTSLPADIFSILQRGRLQPGQFADVTLLDWDGLGYQNDFLNPTKKPDGIAHVLVNGVPALRDGQLTGMLPGKVLRKV